MQTRLIRQLLDFLGPKWDGNSAGEQTSEDLASFAFVMKSAQAWGDLRRLVDVMDMQLCAQDTPSKREGFATYRLEREDQTMLLAAHRSDTGDALHITQHIVSKNSGGKREPVKLRLLVNDIEDGAERRSVVWMSRADP